MLPTYKGKTIAEWAKEKNMPYQILYNRIYIHKWTMKKAVETPYRVRNARSEIHPTIPLARQSLSVKVPNIVDKEIRKLPDEYRINFLRKAIVEAAKKEFPALDGVEI